MLSYTYTSYCACLQRDASLCDLLKEAHFELERFILKVYFIQLDIR
jgi:hypothetical protein